MTDSNKLKLLAASILMLSIPACGGGSYGQNNNQNNQNNNTPDSGTQVRDDAGSPGLVDGLPCSANSQCGGGLCLTPALGYPNGYCTTSCDLNACPGTEVCSNYVDPSQPTHYFCGPSCTTASDCGTGYACLDFGTGSQCTPNACTSNSDCSPGQICDLDVEICIATPANFDAGYYDGPGGGIDGGFAASFPPPPQLVNVDPWNGTVLIPHPVMVPVFFANDDMPTAASIADFEGMVGSSNYWAAVVSEYGIGTASRAAVVNASDMPTGVVADADVQSWIQDNVTSGVLPQPTSSTVYVMHYPVGVSGGDVDCMSALGYHSDVLLAGGQDVPYLVIPRCPDSVFQNDSTGLLATTDTLTHELAESSTDPYGDTYANADELHYFWNAVTGGGTEVADMCEWDPGPPGSDVMISEFPGYAVQRIWSNRNAVEGHDPCQPELPGEIYANAAPELPDVEMVGDGFGGTVSISALSVPVGMSATMTLDLYSEAALPSPGTFTVSAFGFDAWFQNGTDPFTVTQSATSGQNGQQITLTITRQAIANEGQCTAQGASTTAPCFDLVVIQSTVGSNVFTTFAAITD